MNVDLTLRNGGFGGYRRRGLGASPLESIGFAPEGPIDRDSAIMRAFLANHVVDDGFAGMIRNYKEMGQLPLFQSADPTDDPYAALELESSPALQQRIEELTGLPYDYYTNLPGTARGTQTTKAEGL